MHRDQLVAEDFFQDIERLLTGAVAGVIHRVRARSQLLRDALDQLARLDDAAEARVDEVKAREHRVGRAAEDLLRAAQNVHDAAVRAAAEQRRPAALRNDEVLLVAELVHRVVVADLLAQRVVRVRPIIARQAAGEQRQLVVDGRDALGKAETGLVLFERLVEPDERALGRGHDVVAAPGFFLQVHRRVAVALAEQLQPAAVVVVRVGEERRVHRRDIDAELFGVFKEHRVGAHVKEDAVLVRRDVHGQAVRAAHVGAADGVFEQNGDFHGDLAFRDPISSFVLPKEETVPPVKEERCFRVPARCAVVSGAPRRYGSF